MESGDIAWVLVSAALVMFMVPGLALFYGGMVRTKNVLNMLLMNVYCLGIIPILWVVVGYSLALSLGPDIGLIGSLDHAFLKGITDPEDLLFIGFLGMFAVITPALISGAVADRMRFAAWAVFVPVWSLLVYAPVTYWIYGENGWLLERGSLDFAGGTAIHINAGVAALALVLVLGRRKGWPDEAMPPHNLTLVMIGAGILWFGWYGFNAGSAGEASGLAVQAWMNTTLGAAAGMLGWLAIERIRDGHFTTLGAASGVVAGLVAITPGAGFVGGMAGIVIGAVAGVLCYLAVQLKRRFRYDDSLDVVGVHMVGGIVGGVAIGFFADSGIIGSTPGDFADGLFFGGGAELLVEQVFSIVVVLAFSFVVTFVLAKVLDAVMGLRVPEEVEVGGLDQAEHAEAGYNMADLGSLTRAS
jgi:ammonium transporter, Amt family